jgi:type IX secretion system PorP/SprF family membrane protein
MKRYIILFILTVIASFGSFGQNRQDIAGFSQFKQYFNPALTGQEGSSIKNFYRDQMVAFDNSPKTLFLSGEANLSDLIGKNNNGVQHGFGLAILHDAFGATKDNRVNLSYSATIKIAENLNLRAGVAATYNSLKIDHNELILGEEGDAAYLALLNGNNTLNKFGANIGVALSSDDFYVGYSLNDAVKSGDGIKTYFNDVYVMQHSAQAGYRRALSDNFGLSVNGIFRYDENQKGIAEGQLKAIFMNMLWIGGGYRQDIAYTVNTGIRFKQFKVGYSRELTSSKIGGMFRGGNELVLSYNFTPAFGTSKKMLTIW